MHVGSNGLGFRFYLVEMLIHLGQRAENGDVAFLEGATNEEEAVLFAAIKR